MRALDHPLAEGVAGADDYIAKGCVVHQKFTCAGCGARLTIDTPNVFYRTGTCDKCPAVTNIEQHGCNYLLIKMEVRDNDKVGETA